MPIDRTRRFSLPSVQDLSKDQDAALALPLVGQHLIVGGPGTGKSVVALLRVRRLAAESENYRFLAYNRLLDQSSRHLFGSDLNASTLDTWFRRLWKSLFKESVPLLQADWPGGYQAIDWQSVTVRLQDGELPQHSYPLPFLVIDEGQDMPPAFYNALANLGFEHFYVVADQNQQIHPEKCSARRDIEHALGITPSDTLELQSNYRNTRPIAQLAQHFYPDDPASPKPELPPTKPASAPELWHYGKGAAQSLQSIADRILELSDRNPRKLIGVITPNNRVREKFVAVLNCANPALDHDKPDIRTFVSGQQESMDFGAGGIMVINAQSCKGLEFDTAILADIDEHQPRNNSDALKKRFYVMVARAREQIILLRTGSPVPAIEELLPQDQAVLVRK